MAHSKKHNDKKKITAKTIWLALCSKDVHDIGYSFPDSEWIPVNIERLKAALRKVTKNESA